METMRIDWEEDNDLTAYRVRSTYLDKYNNLLTSGRCSKKYPKDSKIIALAGVYQNIADESKK